MLRYNVLLKNRHGPPVRSVVILLRPKADGPEMTGVVRHTVANEPYLEFQYRVVRIWQKPVDEILAGGVGTLALAPLANVKEPELPAVIQRMKDRARAELPPGEEAVLWTATYVLMGLRFDDALAKELLKGVRAMEESVTYQAIIRKGEAKGMAEGEIKEAQRILLLIGTGAFGAPDAATKAALAAIEDRERLETLIQQVAKAKSWQELLAKPRVGRRNGAKRKK